MCKQESSSHELLHGGALGVLRVRRLYLLSYNETLAMASISIKKYSLARRRTSTRVLAGGCAVFRKASRTSRTPAI
jgi:hypothetical protein